jgi:ABC-type bacteriocin/lantibiotic exporter with double-glycine peptidase domain
VQKAKDIFQREHLAIFAKGRGDSPNSTGGLCPCIVQMILADAGIFKSEAESRSLFGSDRNGALPTKIPEVLSKFGLDYECLRDLTLEDLKNFTREKSAIAYVSTSLLNMLGHVIVIDGFEGDYVLVRDSQDGVSYKLHIEDLKLAWLDHKTKTVRQ